MDWFFDNLKLFVFIAIIVIYVIKAMRARSEGEGGPPGAEPSSRRVLDGEEDPQEVERTRQIQEEIRRRILARQRGESPTPAPVPVDSMEEAVPPPPIPPPIPVPSRMEPVEDPYAREHTEVERQQAQVLEAQRMLDEQLRQVRLAREMATAAVPSLALPTGPAPSRRTASVQRGWRAELAGRSALRRAIVLREVLGEPVALRRGPAGMTHR